MTPAMLIENIRPGMKSSEVYKMALKKAESLRVEESFLNLGGGKRLKVSL